MPDPTKRPMTMCALVAALALMVAACGGSDDVDDTAAGAGASAAETTGAPTGDGAATETGAATEVEATGGATEEAEPAADDAALAEPTTLNITAGLQGLPYLQLLVAEDQGYYDERNLDVETIEVAGTTAIAAVEAGQADLTVTLPENIINARAQGSTLKIVGATVSENLYRLYATPDITSLDDLAGQQVGMFNEGNGTDIQLRWLLDQEGAGHEQSTFVALGGLTDRLAALLNDQVKASLLFPPFDVEALRGGLTELAVMRDYVQGYPNEVIAVTDQYLADNPDVVRAFLSAVGEASTFIDENPDEAIRIAAEATDADQELIAEAFALMEGTFAENAAVDPAGLEWTLGIVSQYSAVGELPTLDDLYDPSYVPGG